VQQRFVSVAHERQRPGARKSIGRDSVVFHTAAAATWPNIREMEEPIILSIFEDPFVARLAFDDPFLIELAIAFGVVALGMMGALALAAFLKRKKR
jgi:hypothetical protein